MSRWLHFDWLASRNNSRRSSATRKKSSSRRLRIEPLEDRRMLAVLTVNSDADDLIAGDGLVTLREAIIAANVNFIPTDLGDIGDPAPVLDTIVFDPSLDGSTILLDPGLGSLPVIIEDLTIDASELTSGLTIDGGYGFDGDPGTFDGFTVLIVGVPGVPVEFIGLSITGGNPLGAGGGILNAGDLTVTQCNVFGNSSGLFGGGIDSDGMLTVVESTITDNMAVVAGGGIYAFAGDVTIVDSTISNNASGGDGGGLGRGPFGPGLFLTIEGSTFFGNTAVGDGGGIWLMSPGGLTTTITNSTISGNEANDDGGGVALLTGFFDVATVEHCTITDNSADADADGFGVGGGSFSVGPALLDLEHTIVAENVNGFFAADDVAGVAAAMFSLVGFDPFGAVIDLFGNLIGVGAPVDPMLGPLSNNGGPTLTRRLLPGSPAIDAGDPAYPGPLVEDQRGFPFVRVDPLTLVTDIGAYELQDFGGPAPIPLIVSTLVDESDGDYGPGDLSLREAIGLANGNVGILEAIFFAPALAGGTIELSDVLGEMVISDAVIIDIGPLDGGITIDAGNGADELPGTGDGSRIFNIDNSEAATLIDVELIGLTLTGGDVMGDGGAILSMEDLTVTNCRIVGNSAVGVGADGGGIFSDGAPFGGSLTVVNSTVSGNAAEVNGGGIRVDAGALDIVTISGSTIAGNTAGMNGGGIWAFAFAASAMDFTNCTISGNLADGFGGGAWISTAAGAPMLLMHNTIAGNVADADDDFIGTGGGVNSIGPGAPTLSHSIVADNELGPGALSDVSGDAAGTFNLIGVGTGLIGLVDGVAGNMIGTAAVSIDPMLAPLGHNGGRTLTHRLLPGSPAIDTGDPAYAGILVSDQRGAPFLRVDPTSMVIDRGAYELQTLAVPPALVVDTLVDESDGDYSIGDMSLRDALGLANGNMGFPDVIIFDASLEGGTIELDDILGTLEAYDGGAIDASALPGGVTISAGNGADGLPGTGDGMRIFKIDDFVAGPMIVVDIVGLTLTGGDVTGTGGPGGGAIFSAEAINVIDCEITGNATSGEFAGGGGIASVGPLVVIGSTISMNSTSDESADGGGIYNSGLLSVTGSSISGNSTSGASAVGGGIANFGTLTVTDSTVSGNSTSGDSAYGGGIHNIGLLTVAGSAVSENSTSGDFGFGGGIASGGTAVVSDSTISENSTTGISLGGGMFAMGSLSVTGSTVAGNSAFADGGGISTGGTGSTLTLSSSTVSGNVSLAGSGGGISINAIGGTLVSIDSSTISGNSAGTYGGGMLLRVPVGTASTINRSTITGNSSGAGGGGITALMSGTRTLALNHTIVAGNSDSSSYGPDIYRVFTGVLTANYSLIGDGTGSGATNVSGTSLIGTAAVPIDPMLGPLADNGRTTMTHAVLPGSPAINAGDPAAMAGVDGVPVFDQRGTSWSRVVGGMIDIGAFEYQPLPPGFFGEFNLDGVVDAADYVNWRNTLGTTVVPAYSGADGDGDGIIDQDDYDVWRAHFGQMLPAPAAGSVASAAAVMVEPAIQTEGENGAATSVGVYVVAPPAPQTAYYRPASRLSLDATAAAAANLRDDALLAWHEQSESRQKVRDWQEQDVWENEETSSAGDLQFDSVDQAFALLSSG